MRLADKISLQIRRQIADTNRDILIPNYKYYANGYGYEADIFKITKAGICTEHEIKISRSDYFNDFKKDGKHEGLKNGTLVPNHFYFVVPVDLVKIDEVPIYCGLIYVYESGLCKMIRPAKKLHDRRFSDYKKLAYLLSFREDMWRNRLNKLKQ